MKILYSTLILSVVAASLISCGPLPSMPAVDPPTPTAAPTANRWEAIAFGGLESPPSDDGWKTVRLSVALENRTYIYSIPFVKLTDAKLYTDNSHYYPMEIFKTSCSKVDKVTDLNFQRILPRGFRLLAEFQNDAIVSYYFQSQIPQAAKPQFIRASSYAGDIKVITATVVFPIFDPAAEVVHSQDNQVPVGSKLRLSVGKFTRIQSFLPTLDRISGSLSIVSENEAEDTTANLTYYPIGEDGIVGIPYIDSPDCKPKFKIGPTRGIITTICALVLHGAKNQRMVFVGDANEVYEVNENGK
jgi:hypothetical protein